MIAGAATLLLLAQSVPVSWGEASNGVKMGLDRTPEELRVHFVNTGPVFVTFTVGGATGVGNMVNVEVTATDRKGRSCKLADTTVGSVGGHVAPIVMRLAPGKQDYASIALDKLRCLARGRNLTLRQMIREGYAVRAVFTATAEANAWAKVPSGSWTGTIKSGEIP